MMSETPNNLNTAIPPALDELPAWQFAIRLYAIPGIPEQLVALQDQHGVDVSFFLFLLYLAFVEDHLPSQPVIDELKDYISDWRLTVVQPLRKVRREMKKDKAALTDPCSLALRREVSMLEIRAEQVEIYLCGQWLSERQSVISYLNPSDASIEKLALLSSNTRDAKTLKDDFYRVFQMLSAACADIRFR